MLPRVINRRTQQLHNNSEIHNQSNMTYPKLSKCRAPNSFYTLSSLQGRVFEGYRRWKKPQMRESYTHTHTHTSKQTKQESLLLTQHFVHFTVSQNYATNLTTLWREKRALLPTDAKKNSYCPACWCSESRQGLERWMVVQFIITLTPFCFSQNMALSYLKTRTIHLNIKSLFQT